MRAAACVIHLMSTQGARWAFDPRPSMHASPEQASSRRPGCVCRGASSGVAARAGSLLVVLLLRTAHYNLAKLRDVYLHTNTLAALANLAPHAQGLSSHAAQRLVSLFDMLARRCAQRRRTRATRGRASLPACMGF